MVISVPGLLPCFSANGASSGGFIYMLVRFAPAGSACLLWHGPPNFSDGARFGCTFVVIIRLFVCLLLCSPPPPISPPGTPLFIFAPAAESGIALSGAFAILLEPNTVNLWYCPMGFSSTYHHLFRLLPLRQGCPTVVLTCFRQELSVPCRVFLVLSVYWACTMYAFLLIWQRTRLLCAPCFC